MADQEVRLSIQEMFSYIEASPTAAHATAVTAASLKGAGYRVLDEREAWSAAPGDRLLVTRGDTSIIALKMGTSPLAEAGLRVIGAHTDFPGLRVKPQGSYGKKGYRQLGVEVYGGPILQSWFDRDLGLAGRVVVQTPDGTETRLFDISRALVRIPDLAPHIRVDKKSDPKLNKQKHLPLLLGLGEGGGEALLDLIAESAGAQRSDLLAWTIEAYDFQPGTLAGLNDEFACIRSIDNLSSCHAGLSALLADGEETPHTQVLALFDNEEIGSTTRQGAQSGFLDTVLERLCGDQRETFHRTIAASTFLSVDGAHALHPNFVEAHEPHHHPLLGGGVAIKTNANERYTTNLESLAMVRGCAARAEVPLQDFVARTDVGTGSTIGPMTSSRLGIRGVDLGIAMLAMHSIRETCGSADPLLLRRLLVEFLTWQEG
jgi:aspartyl aminopeptidase